jgi:hypothetical protein
MPALSAASTPLGASSNIIQAAGSVSNSPAAFKNVSGCGLLIVTSSALTIALKYLRISSWSRIKSILKGQISS